MRPAGLVLVAVLGALGSGCGDDDNGGGQTSPPGSVEVRDFEFTPVKFEARAGEAVTWRNEGEQIHNVKGDGFFSRAMNSGDTFEHTFDKKGSYDYICTLHPQMQGTVVVG